jgi:hypothetical protein
MVMGMLTDEQLERMRSYWVREEGALARDMVSLVDECVSRRVGEAPALRGMKALSEDEALLALADACSTVPTGDACKEFAALKRCGWDVQWTLDDAGFVITAIAARKGQ